MSDIYQQCEKCGNIFISTATIICPSCGYQIKYVPTYTSNNTNMSATHRPVQAPKKASSPLIDISRSRVIKPRTHWGHPTVRNTVTLSY